MSGWRKQLKTRKLVHCLKCGWSWLTFQKRPAMCPKCKDNFWDMPPKGKLE